MSKKDSREWVAMTTWADETAGKLIEEGGVYARKPYCPLATGVRELEPGEAIASCARCGQRFAAVNGGTAESWRDLHFYGDEEIPSICAEKEAATC